MEKKDEKLKECLVAIGAGDQQAFRYLYDFFWEDLYKSAFAIAQTEEIAKDIIQDVFIQIWNNRKTQNIENIEAYLQQSVRFGVARYLKTAKLTLPYIDSLSQIGVDNSLEEQLDYDSLQETIERYLNHLPPRTKEVFYLSRVRGLSNDEISQQLNLSKRTVEWHLSEALKHLRNHLGVACMLLTCFFKSY